MLNERHLRIVLAEYAAFYKADPPHDRLTIEPSARASRTQRRDQIAAGVMVWCMDRSFQGVPSRGALRARLSNPRHDQ